MYNCIKIFIAVFISILFVTWSFAAIYQDRMSSVQPTTAAYYYNLVPAVSAVPPGLPDTEYTTLQAATPPRGGVVYQLQRAEQITVTLYSPTGTAVCKGANGTLRLEHPAQQGGLLTPLMPVYSLVEDKVLLQTETGWQQLFYEPFTGYCFAPYTGELPQDLLPYGLVISTSVDGTNYSVVASTRQFSHYLEQAALCTEQWSAVIPPTARYIKVEVNDVTALRSSAQVVYPKTPRTMPQLADITIYGQQLAVGHIEEVLPEETITKRPEKEQPEKQAAQKLPKQSTTTPKKTTPAAQAASTKTVPTPQKTPPTAQPQTANTTKKGTTTKSTTKKSGTSSALKRSPAKTTTTPKTKANTPENKEDRVQENQKTVYYVESSTPTGGFVLGVRIYILIAAVVLVLLLVKPKKN